MDNIICPHCGKDVELSEAIVHQLSQRVREEEKEKQKVELEKAIAEEKLATEKRIREQFEVENKESQKELEKAKEEKKQLLEKIEEDKKLQEEREEKIKTNAIKNAEEAQSLKLKEKDIQMDQIKKLAEELRQANEDLKKKLEQGSQQLQGEALELNLEEKLKSLFPNDEFVPIPKGVEGGDIWQKVKFQGKVLGSIIWETKRTKSWSKGWLIKLKEDAGKVSATEAIIVSQVLPDESNSFDRIDGVWITTYEHALNICRYVRYLIINVANAKSQAGHTEEEWGMIRDYMMSDDFKHRMQSHFDGIKSLRESLEADKRATTLRWKKQEVQINKLDMNTTNFYGELKAIVPNLPELEEIEGPILIGENDEEQNPLL